MWPGRAIGTFDFTCRRGVTLNPCISATNHHFENLKKCFQFRFLRMYHKNFQRFPWTESIEVARPTIFGFGTQKSPFFECFFFAIFSGIAHELMVLAKPPNIHPRPHLMPKEPTDLLNLSRRWMISGVQNVTLYYKIDKIQLLVAIQMVTGPRAIQNTLPLVSISNRTRDINPWKIGFCHWSFSSILVTRTVFKRNSKLA